MTLFVDAKDLIRLRAGQVLPFTAPGELGRECVLAMPGVERDSDNCSEHCVRVDETLLRAVENGTLVALDPGLPIDAFLRSRGVVPARGTLERLLSKLFAA